MPAKNLPGDGGGRRWMGIQLLGHRLRRSRLCTCRSHCLLRELLRRRHTFWLFGGITERKKTGLVFTMLSQKYCGRFRGVDPFYAAQPVFLRKWPGLQWCLLPYMAYAYPNMVSAMLQDYRTIFPRSTVRHTLLSLLFSQYLFNVCTIWVSGWIIKRFCDKPLYFYFLDQMYFIQKWDQKITEGIVSLTKCCLSSLLFTGIFAYKACALY